MLYKFIDQNSPYYIKAITLRVELFFKNMENSIKLIHDQYESISNHIVCLDKKMVIGTGRLTLKNNIGIISQVAVSKLHQHQGIGKEIINVLIDECKKQNVYKVTLSARQNSIFFYKKFNFKGIGDIYPSKKTGILHQNMELILK